MIIKQKGTTDIYGIESKKWQYVSNIIDEICEKYNYNFIRTPVFEATELFHRSVGETTDIVIKETYDFIDRGNRSITLRPEGTAGVVRSFIENKMYGDADLPKKFYYNETMYRYERPQSGRMRELTQFGCEVIGSDDPYIDAEIISLPVQLFTLLGLKGIKVHINSLGDNKSRENYHKALIDYFKPKINNLCEDCKKRLENNPLRILDCKVDSDSDIIKNAPKTIDYLTKEAKERFEKVKKYLDIMDIEYIINPKIVRGLDYYNHTVFEIEATVESFGSQNILAGGGRYNRMIETLDGPPTPAIGFACGLDRLMLAIEKEDIELNIRNQNDVYIIYITEKEKEYAINLCQELRMNDIQTEIETFGRSIKAQFKQADRLNTKFIIILNEEEINCNKIKIKDNITKEEIYLNDNEIIDYINMNI